MKMDGYYGHMEEKFVPDFEWVERAGHQINQTMVNTQQAIEAGQIMKRKLLKADKVYQGVKSELGKMSDDEIVEHYNMNRSALETLLEPTPEELQEKGAAGYSGRLINDFGKGFNDWQEKGKATEKERKVTELMDFMMNDPQATYEESLGLAQADGITDDKRISTKLQEMRDQVRTREQIGAIRQPPEKPSEARLQAITGGEDLPPTPATEGYLKSLSQEYSEQQRALRARATAGRGQQSQFRQEFKMLDDRVKTKQSQIARWDSIKRNAERDIGKIEEDLAAMKQDIVAQTMNPKEHAKQIADLEKRLATKTKEMDKAQDEIDKLEMKQREVQQTLDRLTTGETLRQTTKKETEERPKESDPLGIL